MSKMQKQESRTHDVRFCLFCGRKDEDHRKLLLRNLLVRQLFHLREINLRIPRMASNFTNVRLIRYYSVYS